MKERIRNIMQHERLSQQEFAARLGISAASLSSIFTGRTNPTNNHVMAVHRAFPQINVNWLRFGEGSMLTPEAGTQSAATGSADLQPPTPETDAQSAATGSADLQPAATGSAGFQPTASSAFPPSSSAIGRTQPSTQRRPSDPSFMAINIDKRPRRIKEIRVFFDDGTYESFVPSSGR